MKSRLLILILLAGAILAGALAIGWWKGASQPVSSDATPKSVLVVKGTSGVEVGNLLYEEKLIKSPLAFKIYIQFRGVASKIQAGEYQLASNLTLGDLVARLLRGPNEVWVTVPEGLRREEIPERFIAVLGLTEEQAVLFREEFLENSAGSEGYLFPDTYLVPKDITGLRVFQIMRNTFDRKITDEMQALIDESEYSLEELVILASILERETKTDAERPTVAGIYFNRLAIGMALQADATAQYAVANTKCGTSSVNCDWWTKPTRADLQTDSPYNTYVYAGLPPAPIANPGLSSLAAVFDPQPSDYFYYIHDASGNIYYAETLSEHNANVSRYLR